MEWFMSVVFSFLVLISIGTGFMFKDSIFHFSLFFRLRFRSLS